MNTLTVGLAVEVAEQGIRVNAVAAGLTDTELHARAGEPGRVARVAPQIPLRRAARPDEIARAALWLLSAEASYVTGAVLPVGGGY